MTGGRQAFPKGEKKKAFRRSLEGSSQKTRSQNAKGVLLAASQPSKSEEGAFRALNSIYLGLPVLPLTDRATSAILYATLVLYFAFTAYLFMSVPKIGPQLSLSEESLSKNSVLQLQPGEEYGYEVLSPEGASTVYYEVRSSPRCAGAEVVERSVSGATSRCILQSGNLAQEGYEGVNSGLGNQSILLFSPWMLAASENFTWQVTTKISAGSVGIDIPVQFSSSGKKEAAGRQAFEVLVGTLGEAPARFTVDSEKRVALYFDSGSNLSARLVSAPFPLDWGNSS